MREVDAASSVVIIETKKVAKSWHSSFPIHLGGLYPCRRPQRTADSFAAHPEKEKLLSLPTAAPRRGDHQRGGGMGGAQSLPPILVPLPAILQPPSMPRAGVGTCPACTSLGHARPPGSGAISPGGATPLPQVINKELNMTISHFFISGVRARTGSCASRAHPQPMEEKGRSHGAPRTARGDAGVVPGVARGDAWHAPHQLLAQAALEPGGRRDVRDVATRCPSFPTYLGGSCHPAGGEWNKKKIKISKK